VYNISVQGFEGMELISVCPKTMDASEKLEKTRSAAPNSEGRVAEFLVGLHGVRTTSGSEK
jgi:hypothetical protein